MPASRKELNNGKYIDDQMGNGVPEGGTTGQVLAKASNADYDTQWVTGGGGGSGTVTSIATTSPITGGTITTTGTIGISQATTSTDGYLSSNDWNTFNGKFNLPSLTAGSVLFSNGTTIAQDNANFFWDDTNNRLGIGTATPARPLDVIGQIAATGNVYAPNFYTPNAGLENEAVGGGASYFKVYTNIDNRPVYLASNNNNILAVNSYAANSYKGVGISDGGSPAAIINNSSILLGLDSTTRGFLLPSLTTTQRNAIATPSTGLQVYNNTTNKISYYDGSSWIELGSGSGTVTSIATAGLISGGTITGTGTISTSMSTSKLVGRYSSGTGVMEEISVGSGLTLTGAGILNNTATPTPLGYYGAFSDVTDQFATVINTGYPMLLGVTDLSNQVTVVSGSRVTIANTGIYNIQWSAQFRNPTAAEHDVTIWLRKNGVDVAGSAGVVSVPKKHGSLDGHVLPSWNFLLDPIAGDYYEFVWSTTDTSVFISFEPAGSPPPSTASVVLTVTQQSGIMAGTGITAINSLTGAVQTLGVGTSGTDFAIVSSGTSHTFNLPNASASNRGALLSADWTTFNNKQNALTNPVTGTGTNNELAYFNTTGSTISSLTTATYPSLTELSYVKGTTSAIQTQLGAKQDLSLSAYTVRANNTNATANATDQTFKDFTTATYSGSATWTGTTPPSGAFTHTFRWTQLGKLVTVNVQLIYATTGSALTAVVMDLPSACPTPLTPTGISGNSRILYYGSGNFTGNGLIGATASRAGLTINATSTGYSLQIISGSGSPNSASITVQYYTA